MGTTSTPARTPAAARPARTGPRTTRYLFTAVVALQAALACTQALLAGSYFAGDVDSIAAHSVIGSLLPLGAMLQFAAAVLLVRPGRGPWWPAPVSLLLFFAVGLQTGMGHGRVLAVHVPLGVGVVGALVALAVWSLLWRPGRRTAPGGPR
ncbi:hypothetical protein NUM3379_35410 [Kineococcus sp. NUM-3379]